MLSPSLPFFLSLSLLIPSSSSSSSSSPSSSTSISSPSTSSSFSYHLHHLLLLSLLFLLLSNLLLLPPLHFFLSCFLFSFFSSFFLLLFLLLVLGQYVTLRIEFPFESCEIAQNKLNEIGYLSIFALLKHENKLSVMHCNVQRNEQGGDTSIIKSKEELFFQVRLKEKMKNLGIR